MSTITAPTEVRYKRVLGLPSLVFFGIAYMVPRKPPPAMYTGD